MKKIEKEEGKKRVQVHYNHHQQVALFVYYFDSVSVKLENFIKIKI